MALRDLALRCQTLVTSCLQAVGLDRHPLIVSTRNEASRAAETMQRGSHGCRVSLLTCCCKVVAKRLLQVACALVGLGALALALLVVGVQPSRMPVELFWWPQRASLGGAGFPPPAPLATALLLGHCPRGRPTSQGAWQRGPGGPGPGSSLSPSYASSSSSPHSSAVAGGRQKPRCVRRRESHCRHYRLLSPVMLCPNHSLTLALSPECQISRRKL